MPRRKRSLKATKSEHWLRLSVNSYRGALDERVKTAFRLSPDDQIAWLSPIVEDDYAEYYDQAFLDRLGLANLSIPLHDFWPRSGPRWDALARTASDKVILVEAKAYPAESRTKCTASDPVSRRQISSALKATKAFFEAEVDSVWDEPYYQYANRLAHLFFLSSLNDQETLLLFLNFSDTPDVKQPCGLADWDREARLI